MAKITIEQKKEQEYEVSDRTAAAFSDFHCCRTMPLGGGAHVIMPRRDAGKYYLRMQQRASGAYIFLPIELAESGPLDVDLIIHTSGKNAENEGEP